MLHTKFRGNRSTAPEKKIFEVFLTYMGMAHTFMNSITCLHLQTFRSQAAISSENSLLSLFPIEKHTLQNLILPYNRSRSL